MQGMLETRIQVGKRLEENSAKRLQALLVNTSSSTNVALRQGLAALMNAEPEALGEPVRCEYYQN